MAALTATKDSAIKKGDVTNYLIGAAKKIFKGALVIVRTGTGYAETGADSATSAFVGVAYETGDNSAGAAGALSLRVQKNGTHIMTIVGATQAVIGSEVFILDDQTVQIAATTNNIKCGSIVEFISATQVRIKIDNYCK